MNEPLTEEAVIRSLARAVCQRLTRRLIKRLQKMTGALHSGDGSGLKNTWDELCVQMQAGESFYWDAYDDTVKQFAEDEIEQLPQHERAAIWLQTNAAIDWKYTDEAERVSDPVSTSDIVAYVVNEYLYNAAGRWENQRIKNYLS